MLTPNGYMMTALEEQMFQLLMDFVDPDDCWYDHHGYCQAHSLHEGELCPHKLAKKLLEEYGFDWRVRED